MRGGTAAAAAVAAAARHFGAGAGTAPPVRAAVRALYLRGGRATTRPTTGQPRARHFGAGAGTAPPVRAAVRALYLRGGRATTRPTTGQPRVVAVVTGGGGQLFADLLREPGASSCLLEGLVPYHKESCLSFLGRHARRAHVEGRDAAVGFCSADMAALLAESARDRALQLTPVLLQWPDCLGVSLTATIISHYTRRGPYRAHAGACHASGSTSTYSHHMVKGARDRAGEDGACALLALRALAEAADVECAAELRTLGVRQHEAAGGRDAEPVNPVGERASGVEEVPERVDRDPFAGDAGAPATVLVPAFDDPDGPWQSVAAPATALPAGAIVVLGDPTNPAAAAEVFARGADALDALGRRGDVGQYGSWAEPPAPVLFHSSLTAEVAARLFSVAAAAAAGTAAEAGDARRPSLENWGVLSSATATTLQDAVDMYPSATFAVSASAAAAADDLLQCEQRLAVAVARGASVVVAADGGTGHAEAEAAVRAVVAAVPAAGDAFTWLSDWHRLQEGAHHFDGPVQNLDDGSPSTVGVDGHYCGAWDPVEERPHGDAGKMSWTNGVTYDGQWRNGVFHGVGAKMYSRGGGYSGEWQDGVRHGWGTSFYHGKWGYDRWVGPFVNDQPHGEGTMYLEDEPMLPEFNRFDTNGDGRLSFYEVVGRLCGEFGAARDDAEAVFARLDVDGNGTVELSEFVDRHAEIEQIVGTRFERRPDQRPVFAFDRGEPVLAKAS